MRKLSTALLLSLALSGCVSVRVNKNDSGYPTGPAAEAQLFQADRDFADATHSRGIDGWMSFFADDAVRIRYRGGMIKGYDAIRVADAALFSDSTTVLNWQPLEAHAFQRGGVGITIGASQVVNLSGPKRGEVVYRGRYTTVWRRTSTGEWKVIMDTGYPDSTAK